MICQLTVVSTEMDERFNDFPKRIPYSYKFIKIYNIESIYEIRFWIDRAISIDCGWMHKYEHNQHHWPASRVVRIGHA